MTTVRDVVKLALKMGRVISSGEQPEAEEAADGLVALQSLYDGWVASGMFGRLTDVYAANDDEAEESHRYVAASGVTITIPTTIEDGDEERPPRDLTVIETVTSAGVRAVKIYDRTGWVDLLGLELEDDAPLASRGASGLAACLAMTYSEMFGAQIGPATQRLAGTFRASLAAKWGSSQSAAEQEFF